MGLGVSVTERKCLVGLTRNSTTYIQECAYLMRPLTTDLDPLHKTPGTSTVVCPHAVWRQKEKKWEFLICPEFSSQPHKDMVFLLYMEELNVTSSKWAAQDHAAWSLAQSTLHDCLTEASILNPHGPSQKDCWGSSLKRDALGSIPRALTQGPREAAVREQEPQVTGVSQQRPSCLAGHSSWRANTEAGQCPGPAHLPRSLPSSVFDTHISCGVRSEDVEVHAVPLQYPMGRGDNFARSLREQTA